MLKGVKGNYPSKGKYPNNPNEMNVKIAKSICGSIYDCPSYIFYMNMYKT